MKSEIVRSKELTDVQLQNLRKVPHYLNLGGSQFVLYNLVSKESNWGIFKNERLLMLNVKNESLSYLSKVPSGIIPFITQGQVLSQLPKEVLYRSEIYEGKISKFSCQQLKEKNGMQIRFVRGEKKIEWTFYFENRQLMSQWLNHALFLFYRTKEEVDNFYHAKKQIKQEKVEINQRINKENQASQMRKSQERMNNSIQGEPVERKSKANSEQHWTELKKKENDSKQISKIVPSREEQKQSAKGGSNLIHLKEVEMREKMSELSKKRGPDSEFNEFQDDTPLGSFLRNNNDSFYKKSPGKYSNQSPQKCSPGSSNKYFFERGLDNSVQSERQKYFRNLDGAELASKDQKEIISDRFYGEGKSYQHSPSKEGKEAEGQNLPRIDILVTKTIQGNQGSKEDDINNLGGINKKNVSQVRSELIKEVNYKKWNTLFYQQKVNRHLIYFQFVNECLREACAVIDELPFNQNLTLEEDQKQYKILVRNGIEYKIAFKNGQEDSLIYELTSNQPLVSDMYSYVDQLREQFVVRKEKFKISPEKQPSLVFLIDYKHIVVLCKALNQKELPLENDHAVSTKFEDSLLQKMQNATLHIISSADLLQEMRRGNSRVVDWGYLYKKCKLSHLKHIFLAEIYSTIFLNILRSELFQIYGNFPIKQFPNPNVKTVQGIIVDCTLHLINRLFGDGVETASLWGIIEKQVYRLYDMNPAREDVNDNYLLYSILYNSGMKTVDETSKIKSIFEPLAKSIFKQSNPVVFFKPLVLYLDYQKMSPSFKVITDMLANPTSDNSKKLLRYRDEMAGQIPKSINYLENEINLALTEYISYSAYGVLNDIYQILNKNQPSFYHYQTAVSAVKWLMRENAQLAGDLTFKKIQEILYYIGKVPLISHFYQVIAGQQFSLGQYDKGVSNYKRSIQNLSQVLDPSALCIFERRSYLSEIYFDMNRKEECLKQLYQCKKSCETNKLTDGPNYTQILIKIAKISLSMSKFNESINSSLGCLKHLQSKEKSLEGQEGSKDIDLFTSISQLLLRNFQLTRRTEQSFGVVNICMEKCKSVQSPLAFSRLFKIILLPYLKICDLQQSLNLLAILQQLANLYQQKGLNGKTLFLWAQQIDFFDNLELKIPQYFKNIKTMSDRIKKQRLLQGFKSHCAEYFQSGGEKNECILFLKDFFLIVNLVGLSYFQALLKDSYYC